MSLKSIARGISEYPDNQELGIKGSNKNNWVPADWIMVKSNSAIEAGVDVGGEVVKAIETTVTELTSVVGELIVDTGKRLSGSIRTNRVSGKIYQAIHGD